MTFINNIVVVLKLKFRKKKIDKRRPGSAIPSNKGVLFSFQALAKSPEGRACSSALYKLTYWAMCHACWILLLTPSLPSAPLWSFQKKILIFIWQVSQSHLWHSFRAHEDYADGNCCEREGCGNHQNRKNHQAFSISWKICDKYRKRSLFFYCKFLSSTTVNYRL